MENLTAALQTHPDGALSLRSPRLGYFRTRLRPGDLIQAGAELGTLKVLERVYRVLAPPVPLATVTRAPERPSVALGYGDELFALRPLTVGSAEAAAPTRAAEAEGGEDVIVIRAPIHGIFYRRPTPTSAAYVEVGQVITKGQTIGLIEVMKTFNPVTYSGPAAQAVVTRIVAEERREVASGEALLHVRGE